MTLHQKIAAVFISLSIFAVIICLVRNRKLHEEYSWLWLLTGFALTLLVVWYDLLVKLTRPCSGPWRLPPPCLFSA